MRWILWAILAASAPARAGSDISLTLGVPHGADLQYGRTLGVHGFAIRSGLLHNGVENLFFRRRSFVFFPELSYGPVLRFGPQSWLKPALGLGYRYGWWENRLGQDYEGETAIREGGLFLVPRLELGKRMGWFKLTIEYGLSTSVTWTNDQGGGRPVPGERYYRYFPLDHALGVSLGVLLRN